MTGNIFGVISVTLLAAIMPCGEITAEAVSLITVGGREVYVELAVTPEERKTGMQFRTHLAEDHGMLFVFPAGRRPVFWMKNTYIPLSLAFIGENGLITQIEEMEPESLAHHASRKKVRYALEMNSGWFKRNGVRVGDRVTLPPVNTGKNER